MPLIVLGSLLAAVVITWIVLKKKYKQVLKESLTEATQELSSQVSELESSLKASQQKVADLEYTLREREKDLAALTSKQR